MTDAWSDEFDGRLEWRLIADIIRRQGLQNPRVLDVGCYTGGLLKALGENVGKAGVEPNRAAAKQAELQAGAEVWHCLEDIPADRQFDFIVSTDVIEHVPRPSMFVNALISKLAPRGTIIITTGNGDTMLARLFGANWWYWYFLEHISFISPDWVRRFCETNAPCTFSISRFKYRQLAPYSRIGHLMHTVAYGVTGKAYLDAMRLAYRLTNRRWQVSPRGCGVSADHMLVMLKPNPAPESRVHHGSS